MISIEEELSKHREVFNRYNSMPEVKRQSVRDTLWRFIDSCKRNDIIIVESDLNSILIDAMNGRILEPDNDKQQL